MKEITRRLFLKILGELTLVAGMTSTLCASFIEALFVRTVEKDSFRFNPETGMIEWKDNKKEEYRLVIDGLVKKKKKLSYHDLKSLPQVEQVSDFHCIEGWSVADIQWGGFRFSEIIRQINPAAQATHVVFHSFGKTGIAPGGQDHYIESLPLSELIDPRRKILLVLDMNNNRLPEDHGAPLRLIAPYDLGYKSIKFITRIEFAKVAKPGWWTLANPAYSIEARVPESRLRKKP